MKASHAIAIGFLAWLLSACHHADQAGMHNPAQTRIDGVVQELHAGSVETVEVLQIPPNTEFLIRVTPETLEKAWIYKTAVRRIDSGRLDNLLAVLKRARVEQVATGSDIRSGIIFHASSNDRRLGAIYFDRTGRRGAVDNIPASFGENLFSHLKVALSMCE
jgi:hypothetical protein